MPAPVSMSDLLQLVVDEGASDLHIEVGVPPVLRVHGGLHQLEVQITAAESGFRFVWTSPKPVESPPVDAVFPLSKAGPDAQVRFRVEGENGELTPQDHVLLQLVADTLEQRLAVAAESDPRELPRQATR